MEGIDILDLVKTWGWRAVVTALAVLFAIDLAKPLIRKMIKNEQGRHAFYSVFDILLIGVVCYAWIAIKSAVWDIDWVVFGAMASEAYTVLKIVYPFYSNWGLQELFRKIFTAIFVHKKELADEVKKQKDAETKKVIEI